MVLGLGENGARGDGSTTAIKTTPQAVSGSDTWKVISAGSYHTCGIRSDDTAWCWGYGLHGRRGDGIETAGAQTTPVQVLGGYAWNTLSASGQYNSPPVANSRGTSCGILSSGAALCWGRGPNGEMGNGTLNMSNGTPDFTTCVSPTSLEGTVIYSSLYGTPQYCNGAGWVGIGMRAADPCTGTTSPPSIGDTCTDGSVYAGLSPNGNIPMYMKATGQGAKPWNNGNSSGKVNVGVSNYNTGFSNTNTLIANDSDTSVGGTQPHQAAQSCADATAHGHTDWYLPARNELQVLYDNRAAVGLGSSGLYWSSTENLQNYAHRLDFSDGNWFTTIGKQGAYSVRCVRKE